MRTWENFGDKVWSLGTSLGSLGPGSQKGPPEIFSNVVFLHPWGPNKAPSNALEPSLAEKLKMVPTRCVMLWHQPGRPRCNCVTLLLMTRPDETGLQIVQTPPIFHLTSCSDMLTSSQVICNLSQQQTACWQPISRLTKLHAWLQLNSLILLTLPRLPFFNSLIFVRGVT